MSRLRHFFSLAAVLFWCATMLAQSASAAEFASASLMLYRNKISQSNVQMLVVVQPSSATNSRTETQFSLQFASGFSVNGTASAISVSTSGLPTSYQGHSLVAMPGLGSTASSVSGQTPSFNISNLSSGTYYAFFITSGITTPSSAGKYVHTLTTIDGSGTIDTQKVGTNIVANDQVSVSAAVQPSASDGSVAISVSPTTATVLERGDEAVITLTYQHSLASSQQMEIVGSWDRGYLSDSPSSLVTAVTYKVGSATNSDTNVAPVIDLTNRTITWTVPSVTPNVEHEVSFTLKVSSLLASITPKVIQKISVNGSLLDTSLTTKSSTYNIDFLIEEEAAAATATPGPGPTATPAPVASPPVTPKPFYIDSIAMRTVTKDYARFVMTTSKESTYTLFYGLDQKNLTRTQSGLSLKTQHAIELSNLHPDTQYYFRVVAESSDGAQANSDIFTFTTAQTDELVMVLYGTALWEQLPLAQIVDQGIGGGIGAFIEPQHIFAPRGSSLTFTFKFDHPERINSAVLRIQNDNVLGIDTFTPSIHLSEAKLLEAFPGYFTGILTLPSEYGDYDVYLEMADIAGGVRNQELPYDIHITKPIRVFDSVQKKPIEGALVAIYAYEEYKQAFNKLEDLISYNPYTNEHGELTMALPTGRYVMEVRAVGYEKLRKELVIGLSSAEYPEFALQPSSTIRSILDKQFNSAASVLQFMRSNFKKLAASHHINRILRDVGLVLGLLLFILIEYYRVYKSRIVRFSQKSFIAWYGLQLVTILSITIVSFYIFFVALIAYRGEMSQYYVHLIIIVVLMILSYSYLYHVWEVITKKHE